MSELFGRLEGVKPEKLLNDLNEAILEKNKSFHFNKRGNEALREFLGKAGLWMKIEGKAPMLIAQLQSSGTQMLLARTLSTADACARVRALIWRMEEIQKVRGRKPQDAQKLNELITNIANITGVRSIQVWTTAALASSETALHYQSSAKTQISEYREKLETAAAEKATMPPNIL